jgi:hypothetical protein
MAKPWRKSKFSIGPAQAHKAAKAALLDAFGKLCRNTLAVSPAGLLHIPQNTKKVTAYDAGLHEAQCVGRNQHTPLPVRLLGNIRTGT